MSHKWQPLITGLALARNSLDRADQVRHQPGTLRELWADPSSRVLLLSGDYAQVAEAADGAKILILKPVSETEQAACERAMFLGLDADRTAIFAVDSDPPLRIDGGRTLRDVGASLSDRDAEVFTTAMGLSHWHRRHPRCPLCGVPTAMDRGGWIRRCPVDDSEHFPRTDPAAIMLVIDTDDRALLGRRANWPPGWFSTLAGFLEPGESIEAAVVREVSEEAGVAVELETMQFLGSQPWPFPASIMLGFHAFAAGGQEPVADGEEMAEVAWFSREQLRDACAAGEVRIPPAISVARHLIERWYGAELPGDWSRP